MTSKEYQNGILPLVQAMLPKHEVVSEWYAFRGRRDHYSPRVDIAVGPFSIEGRGNQMENYNELLEKDIDVLSFINSLHNIHRENFEGVIQITDFDDLIWLNQNSRCLFAMEIENNNSKKHLMGSLINASALGRVGIGVAFTDDALNTFTRVVRYLEFLRSVEKNTFDTRNFLIVTRDQLYDVLNI